jgi:hypothetical protein
MSCLAVFSFFLFGGNPRWRSLSLRRYKNAAKPLGNPTSASRFMNYPYLYFGYAWAMKEEALRCQLMTNSNLLLTFGNHSI